MHSGASRAHTGAPHRAALDCPCRPVTALAVGGGRVYIHRRMGLEDGRPTETTRAPDRLLDGQWRLT